MATLFSLSFARPSFGQSAADKATARELAAAGIEDLERGDAAAAESRLSKAQALYDAPVHLLYLARAQREQGKLVEASENYRSLVRANLGSDPPAAFVKAQQDGERELGELEPRSARLLISVIPEGVAGLVVEVNGEAVNTAGLSTSRPANPGRKVIVVTADGFEPFERIVELAEGSSERVDITLKELSRAEAEGSPATSSGHQAAESDKPKPQRSGPMGFVAGARLGGLLPVGSVDAETPIADYFLPGIGFRGEAGFRFARYFAAKAYFGIGSFPPGNQLKSISRDQDIGTDTSYEVNRVNAGLSVMATTDPRVLGGFVEVGFQFLDRYQWSRTLSSIDATLDQCVDLATYLGNAIRVGGGMNIPVTSFFNIVPAVDVEVGQFSELRTEYGCPVTSDPENSRPVEGALEQALHYQVFLSIGADFHFGDDWFR